MGYIVTHNEISYLLVTIINGIGLEYLAQQVLIRWENVLYYILIIAVQNLIEYLAITPLKRTVRRRIRDFFMAREFLWKETVAFDQTSKEIQFQTYNQQANSVQNALVYLLYKAEGVVLSVFISLFFLTQLVLSNPWTILVLLGGAAVFMLSRIFVSDLRPVPFTMWDDAWDAFCAVRQSYHEDHVHGQGFRCLKREKQKSNHIFDLDDRDDISETREYGRFVFCGLTTLFLLALFSGAYIDRTLFIRNFQVVFTMSLGLAGLRLQWERYSRERRNLESIREKFGPPEENEEQVVWKPNDSLIISSLFYRRNGQIRQDEPDEETVELVVSPDTLLLDEMPVDAVDDGFSLTLDAPLTVDRGDRVIIQGPSGVGKSTLVDVLAGITPSKQYISKIMFTPSIQRLGSFKALKSSRVIVSQQTRLNEYDSVYELVSRYDLEDGACFPHVLPCVEKALDLALCTEFMKTKNLYQKQPGLSGGERSRIILARALFRILEQSTPPDLLFLDEIDKSVSENDIHILFSRLFEEFPDTTIFAVAHTTSVQQRPEWTVTLYIENNRIIQK